MLAGCLAVSWILQSAAVSPQEIQRLQDERTRFFQSTRDRPGSGWASGDFGSLHMLIFPIGRSDVLYYFTRVVPYEKGPTTFTVTKWQAVGKSYKRVWRLPLRPIHKKIPFKGTLFQKFEHDQPDTQDPAWPAAKADLEKVAPYAQYSFGEHGDISLQRLVLVFDAQNNRIAYDSLRSPRKELPNGATQVFVLDAPLTVLPDEVKLMNAAGG